MTLRYTLPFTDLDPDREVATARLWAAGATGVWDRGDVIVAWFPQVTTDVPAGGSWEEQPERDWLSEWRRGLDPVQVGGLTITPSWRLDEVAVPDPIVIDPGMAFGTGHHATTRFCLERLVDIGVAGARVLDVGTGTGVLAIAARRLDASAVVAIDTDPEAVTAATDNAARNDVEVQVVQGDLRITADHPPFDVVLANLVTATVVDLAGGLVAAARPGGWVVTSGIGRDRCHEVVAALLRAGTGTPTVRAESTWSEVTARRRP